MGLKRDYNGIQKGITRRLQRHWQGDHKGITMVLVNSKGIS